MAAATPVKIGLDLGTNTSVVQGEHEGKDLKLKTDMVFTVVGYAKAEVLPGVLPGNRRVFYGDEAIKHRRYLDLKWPLDKGLVNDLPAAREFIGFLCSLIGVDGKHEIWSVVGSPARTAPGDLEKLRDALGSNFSRFLIVPEPFLAALGIRDDARSGDAGYADPVKASMIVDIGAGSTDLCNLQGFYPTADDQVYIHKAGNDVDVKLRQLIEHKYPDAKLHNVSITRLKEENSFVGPTKKKVTLKLTIHGKPRELDVSDLIAPACELLIPDIVDGVMTLAKRCEQEIADQILGNIILTGGGSQISGIAEVIEKQLRERGIAVAKVSRADDYKKLVAKGALKVARMARDDQWQHPSLS
jgi:rod shape-determining protein MreB